MLRFLRIRNLAVIEAVEVEFEPGFNVLTGETGAGKSILVEAVGLLLGARASADLVRTGEALATIEAIFEDGDGRELIVRREISSQGRSRSFINGALATAAALRDLSARLVELHGQHEHQALLDPLAHLPLLDEYADLGDARRRRRVRVDEGAHAARAARTLAHGRAREGGAARSDRLPAWRDREGGARSRVRTRSSPRPSRCSRAPNASSGSARRVTRRSTTATTPCWRGLGGVWKRVGELATIDPQFAPYAESRDAIKSQLEDLAFFLRRYADGIDASPGRLQQVEDRLVAARAAEAEIRSTAAGRCIEKGDALARERELLTGAGERAED